MNPNKNDTDSFTPASSKVLPGRYTGTRHNLSPPLDRYVSDLYHATISRSGTLHDMHPPRKEPSNP